MKYLMKQTTLTYVTYLYEVEAENMDAATTKLEEGDYDRYVGFSLGDISGESQVEFVSSNPLYGGELNYKTP